MVLVQDIASDSIYPQFFGNKLSYIPLNIVTFLTMWGFSFGLFLLYSTPAPQVLLLLAGEFENKTFWESILWLAATNASMWGL